ncbi:hypothetical protein WISP_62619 [Willisornis vidua]|uniref:Rna-directed dna polymerase from mobile element jockey-like n=1 Tax=Willisornis vidua TaxID=1566151 RepID=A0ABQ9DEP3_9PASS|nr:hypothetical protein WISP_62619 [Willisornis vidua]
MLDLVLTKEGLVGNVTLRGSLGCSDHEMVEFRILGSARWLTASSLIWTSGEQTLASSGIFWLEYHEIIFKDHLLQDQERCNSSKRKSGKSIRRPVWVNKMLLDKLKQKNEAYGRITALVDKGIVSDAIYLDLCRAFDNVLHCTLVLTLEKHGFDGWTTWWVKLLEGRDAIDRNLNRLASWASVTPVQQGQNKVLHLGLGNSKYKLGREWIESSYGKKILGMLYGKKLNTTRQHVLTA